MILFMMEDVKSALLSSFGLVQTERTEYFSSVSFHLLKVRGQQPAASVQQSTDLNLNVIKAPAASRLAPVINEFSTTEW